MTLDHDQLEQRCTAVVIGLERSPALPTALVAFTELEAALAAAMEAHGHP